MSSNHFAFPVGINVFAIRDGMLLFGKRKGAAGEGEWGLPGGHLENGETMAHAAARELKEETSLEAQRFNFVNIVNGGSSTQGHYIQIGFLAENVQGEVVLMEPEKCFEWKWFPLDNLPENIFFGHKKQVEIFTKNFPFSES